MGRRSRKKERSTGPSPALPPNPIVAFGQLLRIALAPSALSDIFVGIALGHAALWPSSALPWLLIPASLGIYHGAMALNDWGDREADARTRPERPIPSGAISPGFALALAAMLILGGVSWALGAGPRAGVWMGAVALLAIFYDLAGRGAVRGPLLLGLCRAGNLGAGLMAPWLVGATDAPSFALLAFAAAYGAHVFFIGRLGRLEDDEDTGELGARPGAALRGAAYSALAVPLAAFLAFGVDGLGGEERVAVAAGLLLSGGLAAWNGTVLLSRLREAESAGWTRASVGAATGLCLRRLPLFAASVASIGVFLGPAATAAVAVAIVGARLSAALRKAFPLT